MPESPASRPVVPGERTDAELAQHVMRGPDAADAEAALCARLAPRVRSYGRRHLRSDDAAAELVQRVLVLTLEKLRAGQVREPERIGSFVLGAARMTVLDMRRRRAREQPLHDVLERAAAPPLEAADPVAHERLARCLDALSDRERDTMIGTYFGEQSSDHLARALGVSSDNIRQIRRRAVARLRQCLGVESEERA